MSDNDDGVAISNSRELEEATLDEGEGICAEDMGAVNVDIDVKGVNGEEVFIVVVRLGI